MANLGDEVQDEITGFKGIVMAKLEALYGPTECRVHERGCSAEGKPKDGVWVEDARLKIVHPQAVRGFFQARGKP